MFARNEHRPEKEFSARTLDDVRDKNSPNRLSNTHANARSFDSSVRTASGSDAFAQDDRAVEVREAVQDDEQFEMVD